MNFKQFVGGGGSICLSGQGSEVHWNLLRNFFVKTILNYCHFSYKNIFWKIVYCPLKCFCVSWLEPSYRALTGFCSSLVRHLRTSDTPMSAVTSALSYACWTVRVQRMKEEGSCKKGKEGSWRRWWRFSKFSQVDPSWKDLFSSQQFCHCFTSSFPLFLL